MHLLWFNLATDLDDLLLGFTSAWLREVAGRVKAVHVITMRAGRMSLPENVRVYSVGKEKGFSEARRTLEFYSHLFRILKQEPIEACFSHMIPIFSVLAAPVLKARGIPLVTWYTHPSLPLSLKIAHHLSDQMVSCLPISYPYLAAKLKALGHGIDMELFSPGDNEPAEPPMILCVGRISPIKYHPTLIKAAALLRERWSGPFQVVILGNPASRQDESYARSLRESVRSLDLEDLVHFQPGVPVTQLPPWYRRAAVHVNLTPTGFGDKVALESMACGRPCLTANEGFRETLGDYAFELLYRHGSPEDLAGKLEVLLQKKADELNTMGAYLRQQVSQKHSLENLANKLLYLFQELQPNR